MFDTTAMEDARQLAKELKKLERGSGGGSIWGVVSRVWVELICYAANHCESKQHAAHLSKDGEIVSFVWLLMAHMGLVSITEPDYLHSKLNIFPLSNHCSVLTFYFQSLMNKMLSINRQ